jgi:translation initiation factor 2B subunit (eIF-2B alpha/beta/delta family)
MRRAIFTRHKNTKFVVINNNYKINNNYYVNNDKNNANKQPEALMQTSSTSIFLPPTDTSFSTSVAIMLYTPPSTA